MKKEEEEGGMASDSTAVIDQRPLKRMNFNEIDDEDGDTRMDFNDESHGVVHHDDDGQGRNIIGQKRDDTISNPIFGKTSSTHPSTPSSSFPLSSSDASSYLMDPKSIIPAGFVKTTLLFPIAPPPTRSLSNKPSKKTRQQQQQKSSSSITTSNAYTNDLSSSSSSTSKFRNKKLAEQPPPQFVRPFKFDSPSPDDIVQNARKKGHDSGELVVRGFLGFFMCARWGGG